MARSLRWTRRQVCRKQVNCSYDMSSRGNSCEYRRLHGDIHRAVHQKRAVFLLMGHLLRLLVLGLHAAARPLDLP